MKYHLLFLVIVLSSFISNGQSIFYVSSIAKGDASGNSQENASDNIQEMIDQSSSGDKIWIAAGTYYPPEGSSQEQPLTLKDGITLYDGFSGSESNADERQNMIRMKMEKFSHRE